MTDKTINLSPFHLECKAEGDGFVMEWYCATEGNKRVKVRLQCGFWWVRFIAHDLWKMIAHRETEVADAKKGMTNG